MPDKSVKTIKDLIYFQYAKIIAISAFKLKNGTEAKKKCYGFIKKTFKDLQTGEKLWSDIIREDLQFIESDKECIYCGSNGNLQKEHIVPRSIRINDRCSTCERIHGVHNLIWGCKDCNLKKGTMGLYTFFKKINKSKNKFYDVIPPLVEKKYLKTIYHCHECAGTLDSCPNPETISQLDIDGII